jgi:CheY-like chemotaxis protein
VAAPDAPDLPREESAKPAGELCRRLRILVVDDNQDAAESLALWVESLGHEALVAHEGTEALETALRARPDLVLLDIGLPGMRGDEVARALRASPQLRDTTLIALSGWGGAEDRSSSLLAGFDQHLAKPIELAALKEVLAATMARRAV